MDSFNMEETLRLLSEALINRRMENSEKQQSIPTPLLSIEDSKTKLSGISIKIQGIVTCVSKRVFLQDGSGGISLINRTSGDSFIPGDWIEVIGTLSKRGGVAVITDYKATKIISLVPLEPHKESIKTLVEKSNLYHGTFVQLTNIKVRPSKAKGKLKVIDNENNELRVDSEIQLHQTTNEDLVEVSGIFLHGRTPSIYIWSKSNLVSKRNTLEATLLPSPMSVTFNRCPEISVTIHNEVFLRDIEKGIFTINNHEVPWSLKGSSIFCSYKEHLPYGRNKACFEVFDNANNQHIFNWWFILEKKEQKYHYYFGIPHCHTSHSDGKGNVITASECARTNKLDFLIATDHNGRLLNAEKGNHSEWQASKKEAELVNKKYKNFAAMAGFEQSTNIWGHINVYNSENLIKKKRASLNDFMSWLETEEEAILCINHPFRVRSNLSYSLRLDMNLNLFEVGNGSPPRGYVRTFDEYFNALDQGWHVGAVNGQDNHSDNWGTASNVTCVIAEHLTPSDIIEAMRARRVYSTESKTLKLTFKANDHWMGSIIDIKSDTVLRFTAYAEDKKNFIEKLQVISGGGKVILEKEFEGAKSAELNFILPSGKSPQWYALKVIQTNDKISLSSAIFINPVF